MSTGGEGEGADAGVTVTEPIPVDLGAVEGVLTSLWKPQEVSPGSKHAVLTRACMSNLIIVCRGRERAEVITGDVDEIVSRHPSRVLLLVAEASDGGSPEHVRAEVSAHCHLSGDRRRVCSEMVSIAAKGADVRKLPSAARSLLVGDLPTSLWWDVPEPAPLAGDMFAELNRMADQVIYSSLEWPDPIRGTLATADWVANAGPGDAVAFDLAWRELRPWRKLVGQSLDPQSLPGALDGLEHVEIEHGSHSLPQAWLLAGWLAASLGWTATERTVVKGREIFWRFAGGRGEVGLVVRKVEGGEPQVNRVRVRWRVDGAPAALTFAPAGSGHLGASADGIDSETRALVAPPTTRARLVAAELQQRDPDPAFVAALRVSRKLAENLVLS